MPPSLVSRFARSTAIIATGLLTILALNVAWLGRLLTLHDVHPSLSGLKLRAPISPAASADTPRRNTESGGSPPLSFGQAMLRLTAGTFAVDSTWDNWQPESPPLSSPELIEYGLYSASRRSSRLPCAGAFSATGTGGAEHLVRLPASHVRSNGSVAALTALLDAAEADSPASLRAAQTVMTTMRASRRAWDDFLKSDEPAAHFEEGMLYRRASNVVAAHYTRRHMVSPPTLEMPPVEGIAAPTWSPPVNPCKRLVVSLSTLPARVPRLGGVLRALKWQRLQPDAILLGIPPVAMRLRQQYALPSEIADDPAITIVPLPVDFGPTSKLMAALMAEPDPDTCIITIDDDAEPAEDLFRNLVTWASMFPRAALAIKGWNVSCTTGTIPYVCPHGLEAFVSISQESDFMCWPESLALYGLRDCYTPVRDAPAGADVVMGVASVLYRRGWFGADFFALPLLMAHQQLELLQRRLAEESAGQQQAEPAAPGHGHPAATSPLPQTRVSPEGLRRHAARALAHPLLRLVPWALRGRSSSRVAAALAREAAVSAAEVRAARGQGARVIRLGEPGAGAAVDAAAAAAEQQRLGAAADAGPLSADEVDAACRDLPGVAPLIRAAAAALGAGRPAPVADASGDLPSGAVDGGALDGALDGGGVRKLAARLAWWHRVTPSRSMHLVDDVYVSAYLNLDAEPALGAAGYATSPACDDSEAAAVAARAPGLRCGRVPRLVVPLHVNVSNAAAVPVRALVRERHAPYEVRMPIYAPPAQGGDVVIGMLDALHGVGDFNHVNFEATRTLRALGWW